MVIKDIKAEIRSSKIRREKVISMLYADVKLRNGVKKIARIDQNSKTHFDEIFNYTLVQFLKNVMEKDDLVIRENIYSYLFGIARNLHLMKLRKEKMQPQELSEKDSQKHVDDISIDLKIMDKEKKELINRVLTLMGDQCKKILMHWSSGYRMKEISEMLGYKNESSVRKKKFDCMKKLSQYMESHPVTAQMLQE